jgi:hypothetical protein
MPQSYVAICSKPATADGVELCPAGVGSGATGTREQVLLPPPAQSASSMQACVLEPLLAMESLLSWKQHNKRKSWAAACTPSHERDVSEKESLAQYAPSSHAQHLQLPVCKQCVCNCMHTAKSLLQPLT